MNQYPVIFVTLKDVEGLTFESAVGMLKFTVSDMYQAHSYLINDDRNSEKDRGFFKRILFREAGIDEIKQSFRILTQMAASVYEKPVILIID